MPDPVSSSSDAELRLHVQRVLGGHYEVEREIGRGGMGIVYRARDARLKRLVAVKLLPPELAFRSEIRSRFLREAETAAQLNHPNIVPIYSVDEREGLVYFIMGYVDGGNLAVRLHEHGSLDQDEVRRILCEVAGALAYAHKRGVIHRDIKPDNILLTADTGRAVVTDFGIARAVTESGDSRLTATGTAIGTPTYMSPEQAAGEREIDGRSDLYSLGVLGYQMLTGEPPFTASSTPAVLVKHLSETPRPVDSLRSGIAPDLARSIMVLLEKDANSRFPDAEALAVALDERRVPESLLAPAQRERTETSERAVSARTRTASAEAVRRESHPPDTDPDEPTIEELRRWTAPAVVHFRKKLAPFLFVNGVIFILAIIGATNFLFVTSIWSIYMAYKYAKLWADGYDWRDVFKQPRDRLMFDVAAETIDDARALFDAKKRDEVRQRERERRSRIGGASPSSPLSAADRAAGAIGSGSADMIVVDARRDRDEILRLLQSIPKRDRSQLPDVAASARKLAERVESISASLAELERNAEPGALQEIEREITTLEAQANPLDRAASEGRVRRLAFLKRQRRAVVDSEQRRIRDAARLEECSIALRNMRLDLRRLKAGTQTHHGVTLLAERAMSLAHDVDGIVMAEELSRNEARGSRV